MFTGQPPYANSPFGTQFNSPFGAPIQIHQTPPKQPQKSGLPRFLNYAADFGGCAFWRMLWPESLLNSNDKCIVHTSTVMHKDANFFRHFQAIKFQRQAAPHQREFIKFVKNISNQLGIRLIYEIDDIPFREDIPHYNKHKPSFSSDEIRQSVQEIMEICGNMSVTCNFMKEYFQSKLDPNVKIDVIPNYIPKFWIGNFYNQDQIQNNYERSKQRPRVCWSGSGAHFDVDRRIKGKDDFYHINDVVRKTVNDFRWVFYGGVSHELVDLVRSGKVEYVPWANLYEYPGKLHGLNINMFIAPLSDNNFNKSKSDLKYLEASALGIPIACQDLCTYENAPIKFKTGDEMIDRIKETLKDERQYIKQSVHARKFAETRFLETETNYMKFYDNYMYAKGSPERKYLK